MVAVAGDWGTAWEELRGRYSPGQIRVMDRYFEVLATTRKTGRIAGTVQVKEMEYWAKFPPEVVAEALQIHIRKYPSKKESYTRGIMRELAREKGPGTNVPGIGRAARGGFGRGKYGGMYIDGSDEGKMPF